MVLRIAIVGLRLLGGALCALVMWFGYEITRGTYGPDPPQTSFLEAIGWHVANWMAALGGNTPADLNFRIIAGPLMTVLGVYGILFDSGFVRKFLSAGERRPGAGATT